LTAIGVADQKKSNSWRRAVIAQMIEAQDYERHLENRNVNQVNHLAGSHTAHRCGWFDFHPGHLCAVDGVFSFLQSRALQRWPSIEQTTKINYKLP